MTNVVPMTREFTDFKVKDLSLAEWGRREIELAEKEMPALMAIREKYKASQPTTGTSVRRMSRGKRRGQCDAQTSTHWNERIHRDPNRATSRRLEEGERPLR